MRIFSGIFADFSSKVYEFYHISFREKFHNFRSLSFRSLSRQEFVSSWVCLSGVCLSGVCLSGVWLSGVCHGTRYINSRAIFILHSVRYINSRAIFILHSVRYSNWNFQLNEIAFFWSVKSSTWLNNISKSNFYTRFNLSWKSFLKFILKSERLH